MGEGLHIKYNVTRIKDGSHMYNCFVIRPDHDAASLAALKAYAETTVNKQLAADLYRWIATIVLEEGEE